MTLDLTIALPAGTQAIPKPINKSLMCKNSFLHRPAYALAAVALWLAFGASAFAQNTGSIAGTVTDQASKGFLVGADVRVVGSELATATARDGTFRLANVPAG